ncbi:MAG TPA: alpha/beta fold hydrolase [Gemmatimonadales bacterium]|nr:alpha/beta fold hydrolase [Gemmatimonadales bacterium]
MSVPAFLQELKARDIQVWADGDQLRCTAPAGVLTPELREQLRQRKSDIVAFLRSAESLARQQRAIVPLQPRGTRAPIFGVPGHNGDVFCYRLLSQQLGEDQPFFGLQPPGADGQSTPLTSVEELARYFATQIRAYRPTDPCVITGYCAGGTIAFELARQLLELGATIRFVALFTSPYATAFRRLPQFRQNLQRRWERVREHARALATQSNGERRRYIRDQLRERKARRDAAAQAPPPDALQLQRAKVEAATVAAIRRYRPRHFDGRLSLFLPNKEFLRPRSSMLRWQRVARQTERYVGPDGCIGDEMLLERHVASIAELFRLCRDANGNGHRV